ncbi:MAG: bactofilin family protein [Spongiibacter marinus]|uniref:bactofilin family protein n=1 Tax=Spongiibacter marinus TaxID=354246 RepID=UPI003C340629
MGLISKNSKRSDSPARTTIIAAGTHFVGDFELKDSFHLDGSVDGNITSQADVTIGVSGHFKGDIKAKRVLVSGRLDGKVDADYIEIVASGQVNGDIRVRELAIESGGQFIGASHVKKHDTPVLTPVDASADADSSDRAAG